MLSSALVYALIVQTIIWLVLCVAFANSRRGSIYHPITFYLLFHGLVFVWRPLAVNFADFHDQWDFMNFTPTEEEAIVTLIVSTFALIVFYCTSYILSRPFLKLGYGVKSYLNSSETNAAWITAVLFAPIGIYSAIKYSTPAGLGDFNGGYFILTGVSGYMLDAKNVLGPIALIVLVASKFRFVGFLPLLFYLGYRISLGSGRWSVVMPVLSLVLIYSLRSGEDRRSKLIGVTALAVTGVVFAITGALRPKFGTDAEFDLSFATLSATVAGPDFANYDYLAYIISKVPSQSGTYGYFLELTGLFTAPIPRVLWPDKPVSGVLFDLVDLNSLGTFLGRTESIVGSGWKHLGIIGVATMLGFAGWLLAKIYNKFNKNSASPRAQIFYFIFLPLTLQWFRDGGMLSIVKFMFWSIGPIIVWHFLSEYLESERRKLTITFANRRRV